MHCTIFSWSRRTYVFFCCLFVPSHSGIILNEWMIALGSTRVNSSQLNRFEGKNYIIGIQPCLLLPTPSNPLPLEPTQFTLIQFSKSPFTSRKTYLATGSRARTLGRRAKPPNPWKPSGAWIFSVKGVENSCTGSNRLEGVGLRLEAKNPFWCMDSGVRSKATQKELPA